jgi:hypothetical protein
MNCCRPLQRFHVFEDYQAKSWPHARRIVTKVEMTQLGSINVRYVVTNMSGEVRIYSLNWMSVIHATDPTLCSLLCCSNRRHTEHAPESVGPVPCLQVRADGAEIDKNLRRPTAIPGH